MMVVHHIPARIEDAYWTLKKVIRTNTHKVTPKIPRTADAELGNGLEGDITESRDEEKWDDSGDSPLSVEKDLLKIVSFQKGNFVQNWHPPATYYHAILW